MDLHLAAHFRRHRTSGENYKTDPGNDGWCPHAKVERLRRLSSISPSEPRPYIMTFGIVDVTSFASGALM